MSLQVTSWKGMVPGANPHGVVDGGLVEAYNLVMRRQGILRPRPGLIEHEEEDLNEAGLNLTRHYGSALLSSATTIRWVHDADSLVYGGDDETQLEATPFEDYHSSVSARGNVYVATERGVRKSSGINDESLAYSHTASTGWRLISPVQLFVAGSDAWFPDNYFVAYRFTLLITDSHGVTYETAPSPAFIVENTAGFDASKVSFDVSLPYQATLFHKLRVYRTVAPTSERVAGDDFALALEQGIGITFAQPDPLTNVVDIKDGTPITDLGVALYTNPGQETEASVATRAPIARHLSLGQGGSVFGAYLEENGNLIIRARTGDMGTLHASGNITTSVGTPNVTIASTTGLAVGQVLSTSPDRFGGDCWIVSITNGTDFVVSENASASGSTATTFYHGLGVADSRDAFATRRYYRLDADTFHQAIGSGASLAADGPELMLEVVDLRAVGGGLDDLIYAQLIERYPHVDVNILVSGTAYEGFLEPSWQPNILNQVFPQVLDSDTTPGRIAWTRADSPDTWHEGVNELDIGDPLKAILGVAWAEGTGYVFKVDGIFALVGDGYPAPFTPRLITEDYRLMTPRHLCSAGSHVYAWTDRGILEMGAGGPRRLTSLLLDGRLGGLYFRHNGTDYLTSYGGNMAWDSQANEIHFHVPERDLHLVYNRDTEAWTEWGVDEGTLTLSCGSGATEFSANDHPAGALHYIPRAPSSGVIYYHLDPEDLDEDLGGWDAYYDRGLQAVTLSSVTSLGEGLFSFMASYSSPLAPPTEGDALWQSGAEQWGLIVSGTFGGTLGSGVAYCPDGLSNGAAQVAYGYSVRARTVRISAPEVVKLKYWTGVGWEFRDDEETGFALYRPESVCRSNRSDTAYRMPILTNGYAYDGSQRPFAVEKSVGRAHVKATAVDCAIELREAGSRWDLSGFALYGEGVAPSSTGS